MIRSFLRRNAATANVCRQMSFKQDVSLAMKDAYVELLSSVCKLNQFPQSSTLLGEAEQHCQCG